MTLGPVKYERKVIGYRSFIAKERCGKYVLYWTYIWNTSSFMSYHSHKRFESLHNKILPHKRCKDKGLSQICFFVRPS